MNKIDIICKRYNLTQVNNLFKLDEVITNILRKDRVTLLTKELEDTNKIITKDNIRYISVDTLKYICANINSIKTNEINYIFNCDLIFDILEFKDNLPIHVIQKDNIKYYRFDEICKYVYDKKKSRQIYLVENQDKFKLKDLMDTKVCTIFGSDCNTNFVTENGIKTVLLKSRKNIEDRKELANKLGIKISFENQICVPKETNFSSMIRKFMPDSIIIKEQFKIGKYIIDMYIPEYNIAIECDEFGHSKYDKEKDIEREKFIKKNLNCEFIRFNPDDKDYDPIKIIQKVMTIIFSKIKMDNKKENDNLEDDDSETEKLNINDKKKQTKNNLVIKQSKNIIINKNNNDDNILLSDNENETKTITKNKVNIVKKKLKNGNVENNKTESNILENKEPKDDEIKYITEKLHKPKTTNCLDCNAEIEYRNKRCTGCEAKRRIKENSKADNRPSLEQLKKEVAESSYTAVGRKYGKSDNAIRKWIKNYEKLKS